MATVNEQICSADAAICANIQSLSSQRALLSQNILAQLRNLVEGVAVLLHTKSANSDFDYDGVRPALNFVNSRAKINFIGKFHKLIQKIASHYTLNEDASERLMLKYYEYLYRLRDLLRSNFGVEILANLEKFPIDLDPSLREYHEKISIRIEAAKSLGSESDFRGRYYIHKTRPFFANGKIYYEVTFYRAINNVNKFDRIIAFTDIDISDYYSANLVIRSDAIKVLGQTMPIMLIRDWKVSIRPCEFDNFARILGLRLNTQTSWLEYRRLMQWLTVTGASLLDVVDMTDSRYSQCRHRFVAGASNPRLCPMLDEVRRTVRARGPGANTLRYLMLRMRNKCLKPQYNHEGCGRLAGMKLGYGCIPFDTMPFCTSLPEHNPRYWDLLESFDATDRKHELLARRVKSNVENRGNLYTPVSELEDLGDVSSLIRSFNERLYYKHKHRELLLDKDHVFIRGYEDHTVSIVEKLQNYSAEGIPGYCQAVKRWLNEANRGIDDPVKAAAIKGLFGHSRVALIYGAAGTGKSTMVDHVSQYFNDKSKLFLTHTHPALDNLKRKVSAQNSTFRTISSHVRKSSADQEYDVLIIDECSTVSNADLIRVLEYTAFKLLVLVGDVFQIESIQFGNWFGLVREFLPPTAVFELVTPFRTKSSALLKLWGSVRMLQDDIDEALARNGYSAVLDRTLFEAQEEDEIILCLNYDGLYGINNVNRFLQSSNPGSATTWRESIYKVGDPVLFHETERFRPLIYNNLKGKILGISIGNACIKFDIRLDRSVSQFDVDSVDCDDIEWIDGSVVRLKVYNYDASDEDDDSVNSTVPFQVAYAVSIHKAQGLEYDSVKVVITDANEEDVSHSIFYTAITRARQRLRIFWTPETQRAVLKSLSRRANSRDIAILSSRRGVKPADH